MNYYWVYPWPVEIVHDASAWTWLGPVLTFLGSVLLFVGSLIVLHRTNQAADHRATQERKNERERDFRLFQRDTLLRLGDEVVEAAIETWDVFVKLRNSFDPCRRDALRTPPAGAERLPGTSYAFASSGHTKHRSGV